MTLYEYLIWKIRTDEKIKYILNKDVDARGQE
jgi:hypothetical protein